jgi:hypothetical protein
VETPPPAPPQRFKCGVNVGQCSKFYGKYLHHLASLVVGLETLMIQLSEKIGWEKVLTTYK